MRKLNSRLRVMMRGAQRIVALFLCPDANSLLAAINEINKTVLIIAHRMRTVAGADKIVVLSDGVVAEQGSPSELYAQNGIYTHMADLQTQGQNWTI